MQYLEGGWAYTGFCRAVHSAGVSLKFIKSSKRQTRKGRNSHTWGCVWGDGHSKMPKEKWQVLERAYRSWLVKRKRQELADQTLVPMSVCLSVRQCWCKGVCVGVRVCVRSWSVFLSCGLQVWSEKDRSVAVNATSTVSWLLAEQWHSKSHRRRRRVWGHTQTQGCFMPEENNLPHAPHAGVNVRVCKYICVCLCEHQCVTVIQVDLFIPTACLLHTTTRVLCVWITVLGLFFLLLAESGTVKDDGINTKCLKPKSN